MRIIAELCRNWHMKDKVLVHSSRSTESMFDMMQTSSIVGMVAYLAVRDSIKDLQCVYRVADVRQSYKYTVA
jgi:hypothetical protein